LAIDPFKDKIEAPRLQPGTMHTGCKLDGLYEAISVSLLRYDM